MKSPLPQESKTVRNSENTNETGEKETFSPVFYHFLLKTMNFREQIGFFDEIWIFFKTYCNLCIFLLQ